MIFLVLFAYGAVALLEVPAMIKRGQVKERRVFWVLLGLGVMYGIALVQKWRILTPFDLVKAVFHPLLVALGIR